MRRKIVAANWKMNLNQTQALELYSAIGLGKNDDVQLIVFPVALHAQMLIAQGGSIPLGIQNFYFESKGAFTGEISVIQVKDIGVQYVLIGHSERRSIFGESNEMIKKKVDAALEFGLTPLFCCGEPLGVRESGKELTFVREQLEQSLFHLDKGAIEKCIIAYEPVWAIGTGRTADSRQAEEMHASIRSWISGRYNTEVAEKIPILYGGSCNPSNAGELFACPNVDGGLIGGASLDAASFLAIAGSF
jgi:triosephosphate isomerase